MCSPGGQTQEERNTGREFIYSEQSQFQEGVEISIQVALDSLVPRDSWGKGSMSYVVHAEGLLTASSCVSNGIPHLWKDLQIGSNLSRWRVNNICDNVTTL